MRAPDDEGIQQHDLRRRGAVRGFIVFGHAGIPRAMAPRVMRPSSTGAAHHPADRIADNVTLPVAMRTRGPGAWPASLVHRGPAPDVSQQFGEQIKNP